MPLLSTTWRPEIRDIADSLSRITRYNGHCKFFSVAQHSVLVSMLCPTLEALMHDAHEAYIGDIPTPVKAALEIIAPDSVAELDRRVAYHVRRSFGVAIHTTPEVKAADRRAVNIEFPVLFESRARKAFESMGFVPDLSVALVPQCPEEARRSFLIRFVELYGSLPARPQHE